MACILKHYTREEELEETSSDEDDTRTMADFALTPQEIAQRRQQIKNKILAVGRMQRVFQLLRCVTSTFSFTLGSLVCTLYSEEAENASELSTATDADPLGVQRSSSVDALGVQGNQIRRHIRNFDDA